jgi:Replication-relaxation
VTAASGPRRAASRTRPRRSTAVAARLMAARSHLTARDQHLLGLLRDHRVLTSGQLAALCFADPTTARHRLVRLHRLGVVDRFRPPPAGLGRGSAPFHYVLDQLGELLVAADRDEPVAPQRRWQPGYATDIGNSQRLRHLVGVNEFFAQLALAARHSGGSARLASWRGERELVERYGQVVRPDGDGIWEQDGQQLWFFYEHDRATEPLHRLASKLDGYADWEGTVGRAAWVLFSLPTPGREQGAAAALRGPGVPDVAVATTNRALSGRPDQAVWWPLRQPGSRRVRLIDLAGLPPPQGAQQRATATARWQAQQRTRQQADERERQQWRHQAEELQRAE